jgi:BTB/POZ domain
MVYFLTILIELFCLLQTCGAFAASGESSYSKTVRFDVGGQVYKVSRTLIEQYPNTKLARMLDDKAGDDKDEDDDANSTIKFIDRNSDRFQYVLDYMRDRQVSLPMTVSVSAFRQDLEYFGFDTAKEALIKIGTSAEAAPLFAALIGNINDDLDKFDALIEESESMTKKLERQKSSFILASVIFGRSASLMQENGPYKLSVPASQDAMTALHYSRCDSIYLKEFLVNYFGLDLVSVSQRKLESPYSVVVKRSDGTPKLSRICIQTARQRYIEQQVEADEDEGSL